MTEEEITVADVEADQMKHRRRRRRSGQVERLTIDDVFNKTKKQDKQTPDKKKGSAVDKPAGPNPALKQGKPRAQSAAAFNPAMMANQLGSPWQMMHMQMQCQMQLNQLRINQMQFALMQQAGQLQAGALPPAAQLPSGVDTGDEPPVLMPTPAMTPYIDGARVCAPDTDALSDAGGDIGEDLGDRPTSPPALDYPEEDNFNASVATPSSIGYSDQRHPAREGSQREPSEHSGGDPRELSL
eukprot:TRINITY_DN351_c0_g1_i3.p1 TRINITY_DN351_c0_g1~~TRINITY_DN351_c0_g1_i3.p1  ORF type:complete len:241 (+),score=82.60 TRINITY_DN351_c0_g1_i3:112-834(+)